MRGELALQTIVERRLIEDEERRTREVTQFYKKESPKWDVVIRSSGIPEDEAWERGEWYFGDYTETADRSHSLTSKQTNLCIYLVLCLQETIILLVSTPLYLYVCYVYCVTVFAGDVLCLFYNSLNSRESGTQSNSYFLSISRLTISLSYRVSNIIGRIMIMKEGCVIRHFIFTPHRI